MNDTPQQDASKGEATPDVLQRMAQLEQQMSVLRAKVELLSGDADEDNGAAAGHNQFVLNVDTTNPYIPRFGALLVRDDEWKVEVYDGTVRIGSVEINVAGTTEAFTGEGYKYLEIDTTPGGEAATIKFSASLPAHAENKIIWPLAKVIASGSNFRLQSYWCGDIYIHGALMPNGTANGQFVYWDDTDKKWVVGLEGGEAGALLSWNPILHEWETLESAKEAVVVFGDDGSVETLPSSIKKNMSVVVNIDFSDGKFTKTRRIDSYDHGILISSVEQAPEEVLEFEEGVCDEAEGGET